MAQTVVVLRQVVAGGTFPVARLPAPLKVTPRQWAGLKAAVGDGQLAKNSVTSRAAFLAVGQALRSGAAGLNLAETRAALWELHDLMGPKQRAILPPLYRDPRFWLREFQPEFKAKPLAPADDQSLEQVGFLPLVANPALAPDLQAIDALWLEYQETTRAHVRTGFGDLADFVQARDVLTVADVRQVARHLKTIQDLVGKYASRISSHLRYIRGQLQAAGDEASTEAIERLITFFGHDMYHILAVPELGMWSGFAADDGNFSSAILPWTADTLRQVFTRENADTLTQLAAFPLGMVPALYRLQTETAIPRERVAVGRLALLTAGLLHMRLIAGYTADRLASEPAFLLHQRPAISCAEEGFFVTGPLDLEIQTLPDPFIACVYNAIKNSAFALAVRYFHRGEEPAPASAPEGLAASHLHLSIDFTTAWQGKTLPNVRWLTVRDGAGGFDFNALYAQAHDQFSSAMAQLTGVAAEEWPKLLASLETIELELVADRLKASLGLAQRGWVAGWLRALSDPHHLNRLQVGDLMQMAAILTLAGRVRGKPLSSGFGLYGLNALAPSGGLMVEHYLVSDRQGHLATELVMALQGVDGLRYEAQTLKDLVMNNP